MNQPFQYQKNTLVCEDLTLDGLAARYGTPLYVYSPPAIVERCRGIMASLDGIPHIAYYAVKANANPALMQAIAAESYGADVGSRGELFLALRAGFVPEKITFSGVGKRDDEIQIEKLAESVQHAGAIFLGQHTPEPVGDYLAGPSHVLPTGGTARHASPLGVYDFIRRTSIIHYSRDRLLNDAPYIIALAEAEGLVGHAHAIRIRL